jgi:hypothetical protein
MSVGLGPPQVSPDGKWVWNGEKWLPLPEAPWEPAPEAVLPQAVAVAAPVPRMVQAGSVDVQPQPAAFSYPAADTPIAPLWAEPARSGRTIYMYAGAAAVLLVMLMMVLNSTNIIQLPWPGGASSSAGPTIRPSPTPHTSAYARADRFSNFYLAPSLASVSHTLPALQSACTGTLSSGCLIALNAARDQVTTLLSNIDHGDAPPCIAAGAKATSFDFQSMAYGLDIALNGYQDNSSAEVYHGIYHFAYFGRSLKADAAAVNAQKARCSKVIPS